MDSELVFGEALLEAYRAESGLAVNPRVILSASAVSNLSQHYINYVEGKSPQGKILRTDVDGTYFVDYLATLANPVGSVAPPLAMIEKHRDMVSRELRATTQHPRVWAKYVWLARYHNAFCDKLSLTFKIDETLIGAGPKLFYGG